MSQTSEVPSPSRAVSALNWFRETFPDEQVPRADSETISAIESLRETVQAENAQAQATAKTLQTRIVKHDSAAKDWNERGLPIISQLDEGAVNEVHVLADICAALHLGPEKALSKRCRNAKLVQVANEHSQAEVRVQTRRTRLAEAQAMLRAGVSDLVRAEKWREGVEKDVEERKNGKERDLEREERFLKKAEQYEGRVGERFQGVRHADLQERMAVLERLEGELKGVEGELGRYGDLPADVEACRDILTELRAEIDQVDQQIQQAIRNLAN